MKAILFGSIGVITETSELQRESFNDAFAANGLNWHWEQDEYASMLEQSGGYNRIQRYANQVEAEVNSLALHQSKSKFFQTKLATETLLPRPGVVETILAAKKNGYQVALVTTTSAKNIGELLDSTEDVSQQDFDLICDTSMVERSKPSPDCYKWALKRLGLDLQNCVAIEDNVDGVVAAQSAGIFCFNFAGINTQKHHFPSSAPAIDQLDPEVIFQGFTTGG